MANLDQWLHFLSAPALDQNRARHPAAQAAMHALVEFARSRLLTELEALKAQPITVTDDGVTRVVSLLDSVKYGYNRHDQAFFALLREETGNWLFVPASDPRTVVIDTYLPFRGWRRVVRFTLRQRMREALHELFHERDRFLPRDHELRLQALCDRIAERAWNGQRIRRRLVALFPTKAMRQRIREAMQIDRELLALARACSFQANRFPIDINWLSFVWRHRSVLERIRQQTPQLLATVAQHMFRHGVRDGADPTRECVKWLIAHGVSKRSYLLLANRSARPFRVVLAKWKTQRSLDALALALTLTESGHDAELPRPAFYRILVDEYAHGMAVADVRERLVNVPRQVFTEARLRFRCADDEATLHATGLEFRTIVDWWVEHQLQEHAAAGWNRWLELARAEYQRRRAAIDTGTWPCALEELRTPDAEVLALATPLALFEEGQALRHCAYAYLEKCRNDQVRLFGASMRHHGRVERATIGLQRGARGWRIWDVRGACNRRLGGHWIPLARQLAEAYNRNAGSRQLPLPLLLPMWSLRASGVPGSG